MTAIHITSIVITLLILGIGYIYISQVMERRRRQKKRLLKALLLRSKTFHHILSGFPEGFLSSDLQVLVHRCLVDTYENLLQLDPKESGYSDALQEHSSQIEVLKRKPPSTRKQVIENPQQLKDIRQSLTDLARFVNLQGQKKKLPANQVAEYNQQIKQLVLHMSVDSYQLNAQKAEKAGKPKLAIHYHTLCQKLLTRENSDGQFTAQISDITNKLAELQTQQPEAAAPETDEPLDPEEQADSQWKGFEQDSDWKKKQVYD